MARTGTNTTAAQGTRTAYINASVLDGTKDMEVLENHAVVVEGRHITQVAPLTDADLFDCEIIDLKGAYLLPGLINMHVHLAGNGKPQKKQRDNEALVRKIMANGLTRAVAYRLVSEYARVELHSGVTTIRTVGGLGDFDTRVRDDAAAGRLEAGRPSRVLVRLGHHARVRSKHSERGDPAAVRAYGRQAPDSMADGPRSTPGWRRHVRHRLR